MNMHRGRLGKGLLFVLPALVLLTDRTAGSAPSSSGNFAGTPAIAASPRGDEGIIRQTSDVTCGPAAVASLLKFYFGVETSEDEIAKLSGTYENQTSSLFGLRNACHAKGFAAGGYRMSLPELMSQVESGGVPVVIHFKEPSLHFALVIGRVGNFIIVSDPSQGNISMDVGDFMRRWSGAVLVVKSPRPVNRALIERRRRSAERRLETLRRAGSLLSSTRF
jgi:predicted double-glycine peptidase